MPANVMVAAESWIYSAFAFLHCRSQRPIGVRIGDHTGIYRGTMFELGPDGGVEIGKYCSVVSALFVTNGTVSIGDYSFIAHDVVIADDQFARPPIHKTDTRASGTRIGSDVWVGVGAVIVGSVIIGDGAVVAAHSFVSEDVPAHTVVAGHPARVVRRLIHRKMQAEARD